jgi:hypothetical protein
MGALKQALIRRQDTHVPRSDPPGPGPGCEHGCERTRPPYEYCPSCAAEYDAWLCSQHEFDLVAARHPGRESEATDAEWWDWVMSGGRDQ